MNVTFTHAQAASIKSPEDFGETFTELGGLFHLLLLERGYYMARRGFIALSLALTDEDLAGFVDAVRDFVKSYPHFVALN